MKRALSKRDRKAIREHISRFVTTCQRRKLTPIFVGNTRCLDPGIAMNSKGVLYQIGGVGRVTRTETLNWITREHFRPGKVFAEGMARFFMQGIDCDLLKGIVERDAKRRRISTLQALQRLGLAPVA